MSMDNISRFIYTAEYAYRVQGMYERERRNRNDNVRRREGRAGG